MKIYIFLFVIITFSCKHKQIKSTSAKNSNVINLNNHFIKFVINNETITIEGQSDINSNFYIKKFPDYHTKESVKKLRSENMNVFCGRISNESNTRMIEILYNYPQNTKLKIEDFKKVVGIKCYTFNYDRVKSKLIDNYFRFYFFNTSNEYTSDDETEGYVLIDKIKAYTDSTVTAEGNFNLNIRKYGDSTLTKINGNFNLEFYIGL